MRLSPVAVLLIALVVMAGWIWGVLAALAVGATLSVLLPLLWLGYTQNWAWIGFGGSFSPAKNNDGDRDYQPQKSLWDWMQLLIIPTVLAFGALWFSEQQHQKDLSIADIQSRDAVLDTYLDRLSDLLIKEKLGDPTACLAAQVVAHARTTAALQRLDAKRQATLLQFLSDSQLTGVIKLDGIDLHGVQLPNINLGQASLEGANLAGANLVGANLDQADLSAANLEGANLAGANLEQAQLIAADMKGADLSEADLINADLAGADLYGAAVHAQQITSAASHTETIEPSGKVDGRSRRAILSISCSSSTGVICHLSGYEFKPREALTIVYTGTVSTPTSVQLAYQRTRTAASDDQGRFIRPAVFFGIYQNVYTYSMTATVIGRQDQVTSHLTNRARVIAMAPCT